MEKWEFRERESFSVERDDRCVYLFSREREEIRLPLSSRCTSVSSSSLSDFEINGCRCKKKEISFYFFSLPLSSDNSLLPRNIWMTGQRQRSTTVRADFTRRHDDGFHDGDITRPVGHSGCSLLARTPFPYNAAPFPYAPRRAPGFHTRCLFFATPSPRVAALSRRLRSGSDTTPPNFFASPRISKWRIERGFDPRLRVSIFELISKDSMTRTNEDVTHLFLIRFE